MASWIPGHPVMTAPGQGPTRGSELSSVPRGFSGWAAGSVMMQKAGTLLLLCSGCPPLSSCALPALIPTLQRREPLGCHLPLPCGGVIDEGC